ncbi:FecCD family ABC transporter permease [Corynebacterium crudilactis]|uniref:ABC transporter permease n=1 Tax=Corynebacterium crudilactis TaxID=1652495 RepID=A0A172QTW5_9CORY|nr:iron ABC transporter permease [Corynebacterium crudilactis]ANE04133.1 ABC transporter permease [Corynebacterium crudilactis]
MLHTARKQRGTHTSFHELGLNTSRRRAINWTLALSVVLLFSMFCGVLIGATGTSATSTWTVISHHLFGSPLNGAHAVSLDAIIWDIRTPRVMLAAAVGAGLAIAGAIMQVLVRNMLADPYILGVNSGASCGAAAALLFGVGAGFGDYALQGSAFLGALVASALIFFVAKSAGRISSTRLLMSGVTIGYMLSAATSFLIFSSDSAEGSRSVMFWLLGSLGLAAWNGPMAIIFIIVGLTLALLMLMGPQLDALNSGDETALTLGISPDRLRIFLLIASCLLVGSIVAMAGSIGFIGLVIPHLARRLVGGKHRLMLPISAIMGAILLIWADIAARTLLAPQEIPIGIITALIGAPFLLILVRRMHSA